MYERVRTQCLSLVVALCYCALSLSGVTRCGVNAALELGLKMAAQRGGSSLGNFPSRPQFVKEYVFTVAWISSLRTFRSLLLGWWVGALTTEGHDLFTLIKNIAKLMAIKIRVPFTRMVGRCPNSGRP